MLASMTSQHITEWRAYFKAQANMPRPNAEQQRQEASKLPVAMGGGV